MLAVGRRGDGAGMRPLDAEEDAVLRAAFGRFGRERARSRGAEVVRRHQQQARWFFCDCRPDRVRPPALVPVAESHVRRHSEEPWAEHVAECDFFLDAAEQALQPQPVGLALPAETAGPEHQVAHRRQTRSRRLMSR